MICPDCKERLIASADRVMGDWYCLNCGVHKEISPVIQTKHCFHKVETMELFMGSHFYCVECDKIREVPGGF